MKVAVLTPRAGVWNHRWLTADGRDDFAKEKNLIQVINLLKNTPVARRPGILIIQNVQQVSGRPGEECVFLFDEQFQKRSKAVREKLKDALDTFSVEETILPMFGEMKNVPSLILAHESIKELEQKLRQIAEQEPLNEPAPSASPLGNIFKLTLFILLFWVLGLLLVRNLDLAGEEKRVVPSSTFVIQLPDEEEFQPEHEELPVEIPKDAPAAETQSEPETEPESEPLTYLETLNLECGGTVTVKETKGAKKSMIVSIFVDETEYFSETMDIGGKVSYDIKKFTIPMEADDKEIPIKVSLKIDYYGMVPDTDLKGQKILKLESIKGKKTVHEIEFGSGAEAECELILEPESGFQ